MPSGGSSSSTPLTHGSTVSQLGEHHRSREMWLTFGDGPVDVNHEEGHGQLCPMLTMICKRSQMKTHDGVWAAFCKFPKTAWVSEAWSPAAAPPVSCGADTERVWEEGGSYVEERM